MTQFEVTKAFFIKTSLRTDILSKSSGRRGYMRRTTDEQLNAILVIVNNRFLLYVILIISCSDKV